MLKMLKNTRAISAVLTTAIMVSGAPVFAFTATGSLVNTAIVLPYCAQVGSYIAFGRDTSTQIAQAGNILVICTSAASYSVVLDAGTDATTAVWRLTGSLRG